MRDAGNGQQDSGTEGAAEYHWQAAGPPAAASTSTGGPAVPDPLAEALELDAAVARSWADAARDISLDFPGWGIWHDHQGYAAGRRDESTGEWDIVRSDSPEGLRAMLEARRLPCGDDAP